MGLTRDWVPAKSGPIRGRGIWSKLYCTGTSITQWLYDRIDQRPSKDIIWKHHAEQLLYRPVFAAWYRDGCNGHAIPYDPGTFR